MNIPNSPISVPSVKLTRRKFAWGHTDFLVKVDLTWVQDPMSSPNLHQDF